MMIGPKSIHDVLVGGLSILLSPDPSRAQSSWFVYDRQPIHLSKSLLLGDGLEPAGGLASNIQTINCDELQGGPFQQDQCSKPSL
jgi:hypothetical protein